MNNPDRKDKDEIKLVKHYIKDLSFENPQTINDNNAENNQNHSISSKIDIIYKPFNDNFFSLVMKYYCECLSKKNNKSLFVLELDYFGFFRIINNRYNEAEITKKGAKLIFPFAKSVIEDISKRGGSISISLDNIDFKLIKN